MSFERKNPFAGYTQIAIGERFIGREDEIERLTQMLVEPDAGDSIGNLAIVGMHRIGKKSLIKHILATYEVELFEKRRLSIQISLKDSKHALDFFWEMVEATFQEINHYLDSARLERLSKYKPERASFELLFPGNIRRFFAEIQRAGVHVIFLLEEFDHARILFAKDYQSFENLRKLSQNGSVSYITFSRRRIQDIELQSEAGSTLTNDFLSEYIRSFKEEDLRKYFALLTTCGIPITPAVKQQILAFCGGHPYLLAMLGWELFAYTRQKRPLELEQVFRQMQTPCNDYFGNVVRRLENDQNLTPLIRVIFGPRLDLTQQNIDELLSYGLIKENTARTPLLGTKIVPAYVCFSESFQHYLRDHARDEQLYSFLGETELALRKLIRKKFQDKYKSGWLNELKNRFPKEFEDYEKIQTKEKNQNRVGASDNILDYSYLGFLCTIVFDKHWSLFSSLFQKNGPQQGQQYWKKRGDKISEMRNPVMHLRIENIPTDEHLICKEYCQEILAITQEYLTV